MSDILLRNGEYYTPSTEDLIAWERSYPNINIHTEILAAGNWCIANPTRRKVNGARFLVNWLKRANDRAPRGRQNSTRDMTTADMMDRGWAQ